MAERNCGFGDCADHYGDESAWCLRCRGLLNNDRRGDADDILALQALLAEHHYDIAGDTLTDCVRVVLLDKAKSSELLSKLTSQYKDLYAEGVQVGMKLAKQSKHVWSCSALLGVGLDCDCRPVVTSKTCLYPQTCPCDDDRPDPCPKCGATV